MSAMRAEELPVLPELPAALPQDSAPSDSALTGSAPTGSAPTGSAPTGSAPSDSALSDSALSDSARTRAAARWTAPLDPPAPASQPDPAVTQADTPASTGRTRRSG